jgi:acyl-CoA thioesterase-2
MQQKAVDDLIALLDLEVIEVNIFRGISPDVRVQRVFGGQVAGQSLVAAARTVDPDRRIHSLHAYFLRPGDPSVPLLYQVDRIRDGRSFTTRRVVAIQHGRPIFNMSVSFHIAEEGYDHQIPMPDDVPDPDEIPTFAERLAPWAHQMGDFYTRPRPIDVRSVDWSPPGRHRPKAPSNRVWLKADGKLPDDPVLHTCVLTYASDMTLLDTTLRPHGVNLLGGDEVQMASLDHAMWFHRPFRADEWLLYDQDTPSASSALGLARGLVYTRSGELVCSVVQEGLIRPSP